MTVPVVAVLQRARRGRSGARRGARARVLRARRRTRLRPRRAPGAYA